MITAFASACHGYGGDKFYQSKWFIVAANAVIYAAIGWLYAGWLCLAMLPLVVGWWLMFRSGKQAQVELRATGGEARLRDVLKAHYYVGWLTCLSLWIFNYKTAWGQHLGWEEKLVREQKVRADAHGRAIEGEMPFWDCRRPTEFLTGLTGDVMLVLALAVLSVGG